MNLTETLSGFLSREAERRKGKETGPCPYITAILPLFRMSQILSAGREDTISAVLQDSMMTESRRSRM